MTRKTTRPRMRHFTAAATFALAAGLALPTVATAQPAPESPIADVPAPAESAAPAVEGALATALGVLRSTPGTDQAALAAAEAIAGARGSAVDAAEDTPLGAYDEMTEFLRALGIQPFMYPTGAPFCTPDGNLPLGIAPAMAGALPGPWPNQEILGQTLNVVDPAQTLFAFVPMGLEDDANADGIQLAWLNVNTLQGGLVPMGTLEEAGSAAIPENVTGPARALAEQAVATFLAQAVPFGGVRVAPVDTGAGTVLAAVFGTVQNGDSSCFFLPTVGIVDVPA
jgi:hypothetical protein